MLQTQTQTILDQPGGIADTVAPLPWQAVALSAFLGIYVAWLLVGLAPSSDLMALWLAASEIAAGHPEAIYPPEGAIFDMRPAMDWYGKAAQWGHSGEVYPYLYPPIWAYLLAPLTKVMSFPTFATTMLGLNTFLAAIIPLIGARLAYPHLMAVRGLVLWWGAAIMALVVSHALPVALLQGQPQILVAALTLYGLERTQNGKPVAGGLWLGLAIALKLAPLPIALIWALSGQRKAALMAIGTSATVAVASLMLAGWPLHLAFLDRLRTIDHTALLSSSAISLDLWIGHTCYLDQAIEIPSMPAEFGDARSSWHVVAKTEPWALSQKVLLLAATAAIALGLRKVTNRPRRAALWALACITLGLLGPIGWIYYYIVPLALVPLLPVLLGLPGGGLAVVALTLLSAERFLRAFSDLALDPILLMGLGIGLLAFGFLWASMTSGREIHT